MPLLIFLGNRLTNHLFRLFRQHSRQLVPILPGCLFRDSRLRWIRRWLQSSGRPQPLLGLQACLPQFLCLSLLQLLQGLAELVRCIRCVRTGAWPERLSDVEELENQILAAAAEKDPEQLAREMAETGHIPGERAGDDVSGR